MNRMVLVLLVVALAACSGTANGAKMSDARSNEAWQQVATADSDGAQAASLEAFLALHPQGQEPRLTVSVQEATTGRKAPIDKALWENPQAYRVTLRYGEQTYVFTPRSRASLEPLFRE